jgi:hypothetical protein
LHRGFLQVVKRGKFLNQAMQCGSAQIISRISLSFGNAKQTNTAAGQWREVQDG